MSYRILQDWGSEGLSIKDKEYETVDDAVKDAIKQCYGNRFYIIQIIDWKAKEKNV